MERHGAPLLQVSAVLKAGAAADPAGRPGLASLTAAMLERGTGSRSALAIDDAVDTLGAALDASVGWHATIISLNVPVERAEAALAVLADVVEHPTFPADELERMRKEELTRMLQWRDQPTTLASVALARALYREHPYGRLIEGTEDAMRAVTREELARFHASLFVPGNATLVAVGDTDAAGVRRMLERAFGSWAAAGRLPAASAVPAAAQVARREVWLVDKPGAAQSEIRVARVAPPRSTPEYAPLVVLNTVLGGSFTSRLNHNLRTIHGYAYGASSVFDFRLSTGPFFASAAVQTDKTGPALSELFKELESIRTIPAGELSKARHYVALRYPAGFETAEQVAGKLVDKVVYGLPDDEFDTYVSRIEAVTPSDVARAAAAIDPRRTVVVVVGDAAKVEKPIEALKLGPLHRLSVADLFARPR